MAKEQENTDQITDAELFEGANEPEAPEVAPEPEETQEAEPSEGRTRDEKGRFKPRLTGEAEGEAVMAEPEAETEREVEEPETVPEERPDNIPSWRLKEEAEARRAAEDRARQFETQLAQMQQQLQSLQPKQEPTPFPDIFENPDGLPQYINQVLQEQSSKWEQQFRSAVANMSLQRAHDRYGDKFMEAYNDVLQRPMDDPIRQQVISSPDPGESLVKLYQREQVYSAVGDDPEEFINKALEEALNNDDFLARAMEKAKTKAGAQPTQNQIDLPPSLNKTTAARNQDTADASDAGMWNFANTR